MLELFETPLTVLHIFVCFFLILVVLIQPGKSGGLGAALGGAGAQQVFGGRGAGNFLSRATWICASTFFVTSMVLAYISSSADDSLEDRTGSAQSSKLTPPPAEVEEEANPAALSSTPEALVEPNIPADETDEVNVQPGADVQTSAVATASAPIAPVRPPVAASAMVVPRPAAIPPAG